MKCHVKKGDEVVVLAGKEKGKRGKIIAVLPKKSRAIVEGLHMIKKHTRKSQQHPNGVIIEREGTIHLSNLRKAEAEAPAEAAAS
jgi:large subunit ribosomal protein L24